MNLLEVIADNKQLKRINEFLWMLIKVLGIISTGMAIALVVLFVMMERG